MFTVLAVVKLCSFRCVQIMNWSFLGDDWNSQTLHKRKTKCMCSIQSSCEGFVNTTPSQSRGRWRQYLCTVVPAKFAWRVAVVSVWFESVSQLTPSIVQFTASLHFFLLFFAQFRSMNKCLWWNSSPSYLFHWPIPHVSPKLVAIHQIFQTFAIALPQIFAQKLISRWANTDCDLNCCLQSFQHKHLPWFGTSGQPNKKKECKFLPPFYHKHSPRISILENKRKVVLPLLHHL